MAADSAYLAELHKWLGDVQAQLQMKMQEVAKKLEEPAKLSAVQAQLQKTTEVLLAGDHDTALRKVALSGESTIEAPEGHPDFILPGKVAEKQSDLIDASTLAAMPGKESQYMKKVAPPTDPPVLSSSENAPIKTLPDKMDAKAGELKDTPIRTISQFERDQLKPALKTGRTHVFRKEATEKMCLKNCLLRLLCYRRRPGTAEKRGPKTLHLADPTEFIKEYSEKQHQAKHIGKHLEEMRKHRLVPFRMWEKRVLIEDATGKVYSLSQWTKGKDKEIKIWIKDREDAEEEVNDTAVAVFPLRVLWRWLEPDEVQTITWKDRIWWKVTGVFNNHDLRAFSMKFHSRMINLDLKVKLLSKGIAKDKETAIKENTTMIEQTDEWELALAVDALTEIDDLICLGFTCDSHNRTISEILESAGCSWGTFFEEYMFNRCGALAQTNEERRMALVNAATRGADGLELLFQQLLASIHANDMMVFKILLILCNGITCAAQFAWSDYLVPIIKPVTTTTTPTPTWQKQIFKIFNSTGSR